MTDIGKPGTPLLTAYEMQVLLGTSIHGCNMTLDRVFDLNAAWHKLYGLGFIDRPDGIAIITEKGQAYVHATNSYPLLVEALTEIANWSTVAGMHEQDRDGKLREIARAALAQDTRS
jgi:hypothetical protein